MIGWLMLEHARIQCKVRDDRQPLHVMQDSVVSWREL